MIAKLHGVTVRGALLSDFSHQARQVLRLRGPDTVRFVQGTVTADVGSARAGFAIAAALLTVKGKLVTDLVVLPQGEHALDLLVPAEIAGDVATLIDRHIIMDQVEVEQPSDVAIGITWADDERGGAHARRHGVDVAGAASRSRATAHRGTRARWRRRLPGWSGRTTTR